MDAQSPAEVDAVFVKALNAGDLETMVGLYEPAAALTPSPGKTVVGTAAIREALAGFLAMKPTMRLTCRVLGQSGDLALVTGRWELEGTGPDGKAVALKGQSVEVVRRQADGRWRFVVDNPWGTEGNG